MKHALLEAGDFITGPWDVDVKKYPHNRYQFIDYYVRQIKRDKDTYTYDARVTLSL